MPRFAITAVTMSVDALAVELIAVLEAEGITTVLLKGASIRSWLYPNEERAYGDVDLLVSPASYEEAGAVLRSAGYYDLTEGWAPLERAPHATTFRSDDGPGPAVCVDLHRTLPLVRADAENVWQTLSAHVTRIVLHGTKIRVLDLPARSFHLTLHAAQHGHAKSGPIEDLRRAVSVVEPDIWTEAVAVARTLGAEDYMAAALRMVDGGRDLTEHLGLAATESTMARILTNEPTPGVWRLQSLAEAPSWGRRAALVRATLLPSPASARARWPQARRGRIGLVGAYVASLASVTAALPRALARWTRVRQVRQPR